MVSHEQIVTDLLNYKGQMVYHPAVIYRRKAVLDLGGYPPNYPDAEDLDLFLRLAEVGQIVNLPEPLLKYRNHPAKAGISRSNDPSQDLGHRILEEARKRHNLGPVPEHVSSQAFSLAGDPFSDLPDMGLVGLDVRPYLHRAQACAYLRPPRTAVSLHLASRLLRALVAIEVRQEESASFVSVRPNHPGRVW